MANNLASPLGRKKRPQLSLKLAYGPKDWPVGRAAAALCVLILALFALRIYLVDDPLGGQPQVVLPIRSTLNTNPVAQQIAAPPDQRLAIVS
ncbi:MAG TPA: hypothetical protein ENJ68_05995, partial [Devosia sp.]|nr:hypothetical protein [Devosia sp.]